MSLESRIQALEDHCNHSLANAKLIAAGGITSDELKVDAIDRPYLGCDDEADGDDQMSTEDIAYENALLIIELDNLAAEVCAMRARLAAKDVVIDEMNRLLAQVL